MSEGTIRRRGRLLPLPRICSGRQVPGARFATAALRAFFVTYLTNPLPRLVRTSERDEESGAAVMLVPVIAAPQGRAAGAGTSKDGSKPGQVARQRWSCETPGPAAGSPGRQRVLADAVPSRRNDSPAGPPCIYCGETKLNLRIVFAVVRLLPGFTSASLGGDPETSLATAGLDHSASQTRAVTLDLMTRAARR